ncbi:MAG: VTT domain-containing protein [Bacteroidales bacterium]|nr:VTT domain-containing protein [Bacteroidales bacterium]
MKSSLIRIAYIITVIIAVIIFYLFDLQHYFQVDYLVQFLNYIQENGLLSAFLLSLILILFSVLNLPTFYFSILFGYLFGFIPGLTISLISRTLGVILAYYNIHFLFFNVFTRKYGEQKQIKKINQLIKEKGFSAIIILRSLYIFPTSFLNAAFSISKIKPAPYFLGSAIGLLPTSIINVSMGYFIQQNQNLSDNPLLLILSIVLALCLIIFSILYMRKLK